MAQDPASAKLHEAPGIRGQMFVGGANYNTFRPTYPQELYDFLAEYQKKHGTGNSLAVDVGCGTGQVAALLADSFEHVLGFDSSQSQIEAAEKRDNIRYDVSPAEHLNVQDHTVDLLTVAQAVHWFNLPEFYKEAERVLKTNGILAIWGYSLPEVEGNQKASKIIERLENVDLGTYWAPERLLVDQQYPHIKEVPFRDSVRKNFVMTKTMKVSALFGYLETWSAHSNFLKKNPGVPSPLVNGEKEILEALNGADLDTAINVTWPVFLICGAK